MAETDIILDYKVGLKDSLVNGLQGLFGPTYPDPQFRNKVKVSLTFPMEEVSFPAVYLTYREQSLQNIGVGHMESDLDPDSGQPRLIRRWKFEGYINFNIIGRTPLERDTVTAGLVNLFAFGKDNPILSPFIDALNNNAYAAVQINTGQLVPGGESVSTVPWDNEGDDRLYVNQYSARLFGEFINNAMSGDLIEINSVNLYPYRDGTPAPVLP